MGLLETLKNQENLLRGINKRMTEDKARFIREVAFMSKTEGWQLIKEKLEKDLVFAPDRNFKNFFQLIEPVLDEQRRRTIKYVLNMVEDAIRLHEKMNEEGGKNLPLA